VTCGLFLPTPGHGELTVLHRIRGDLEGMKKCLALADDELKHLSISQTVGVYDHERIMRSARFHQDLLAPHPKQEYPRGPRGQSLAPLVPTIQWSEDG
jgi:hypothetical protein